MGRGVCAFGKAEWFNPGGSVKDRPVRRIITQAELSGELKKGKVILDATSGNAGISYAMIGAALGYGVRLVVPRNASRERVTIMEALGAGLVFTDPLEGSDGAVRKASELYEEEPDRYFYANQYGNEWNWRAHYEETAEEIWTQTRGTITHLIAGVGTSGTLMGTARRLRELNPRIRAVEVQPDSPFHGLEGLKHMESALRPSIYDPSVADEVIRVRTEDAQRMVRDVAREEGLLIGVSAGAALHAAKEVVQRSEGSGVFVAILPDGGERYLSDAFWEERA
jgi:cysteine synthase B